MGYLIPPGSPLDVAMNVLVAVGTGEPPPAGAMSHAAAVELVEDAAAGDRRPVMTALGMRAWLVRHGTLGAGADEIELRWFGGPA